MLAISFGPDTTGPPETIELVPVVVVGREALAALERRLGDAIEMFDTGHAKVRRDECARFRDLEVDHDLHVPAGRRIGGTALGHAGMHDRVEHIRIVAGTLADLDAIGAQILEALDHRPRLVRRVPLVPRSNRQRPALAEHEPRRDDFVGIARTALLDHQLEPGTGAGISHGCHTVSEVEPVRVFKAARAELAGLAGQMGVHLDQTRDHVHAARIDDLVAGGAATLAAVPAVHRIERDDVRDGIAFDDDVDGALRWHRAIGIRLATAAHNHRVLDHQALVARAIRRAHGDRRRRADELSEPRGRRQRG